MVVYAHLHNQIWKTYLCLRHNGLRPAVVAVSHTPKKTEKSNMAEVIINIDCGSVNQQHNARPNDAIQGVSVIQKDPRVVQGKREVSRDGMKQGFCHQPVPRNGLLQSP